MFDPWITPLTVFGPFAETVRSLWTAETAWIDDWDPSNPARGQCGTSSLVLQDERGGRMVRGLVHDKRWPAATAVPYWNFLAGRHIDLTWQQFSSSAFVPRAALVDRTDLLVSDWVTARYVALCCGLDARLAERATLRARRSGPHQEHQEEARAG